MADRMPDGMVLYTMCNNNGNRAPVHIRTFRSSNCNTVSHCHEAVQINYVAHGSLFHEINGARFPLVQGDIFVIPPYIPHKLVYEPGRDFEMVELEFLPDFIFGGPGAVGQVSDMSSVFDFAYIEPFLVSEQEVKPRLNLSGRSRMRTEDLLARIAQEYTSQQDAWLLAVKADILSLLVLLGRSFREQLNASDSRQVFDRHRDYIQRAMRYIEEHFTENLTVEDVAHQAMLSQSYFSYLFKSVTGVTFLEHLTRLRIDRATELLRDTDHLVADICFESGFKNINHFNRTFRMAVGVSPVQYRRRVRSEAAKKE